MLLLDKVNNDLNAFSDISDYSVVRDIYKRIFKIISLKPVALKLGGKLLEKCNL